MFRIKILVILTVLPLTGLFSQRRQFILSDPGISSDNRILVTAENPVPAGYSYRTLILGDAESLSSTPLTLYPEHSGYYPGKNQLKIYNHFGSFVYDRDEDAWYPEDFVPSISQGASVSPMRLLPLYDSPDGRYSVFVKDEKALKVSLYLYDHDRDNTISITGDIPREFSSDVVKWSPDSLYFIYRRDHELYYFSIEQYLSDRVPAERFRKIGHSYMNSAFWGEGNYLYLVSRNLIYRLHSSEFFTRSFYADPFHKGSVWGRIPVDFDPLFDHFSINPGGTVFFLVKDGQSGFVFPLDQQFEENASIRQFPSLSVPAGKTISDFSWLNSHVLTALVLERESRSGNLYYMDTDGTGRFTPLGDNEAVLGYSAGPAGRQFALLQDDRVVIMDSAEKKEITSFSADSPLKLYWTDEGYIVLGKSRITEIRDGKETLLGLSQIDQSGFALGNKIAGKLGGEFFLYNGNFRWVPYEGNSLKPLRLSNEQYRIYLEERPGGWYAQSLKVRRISSYNTEELLAPYENISAEEILPQFRKEVQDVPWYFSQGSSLGKKEVSLVINAVNSAEGLNRLMDILSGYGVRATFFLNGDFINNYPDGTRMIADSEHLAGSLFYTYFDMSDPKYHINREFLKKGLARNEDDYFIVTGEEMAMIWHTPYYYLNREILDTSGILKYTFIGRELNLYDWVGKEDKDHYIGSVALIENTLEQVRPGSLIPITLGSFAEREDYLYMNLAMLIEGLILRGYDIVSLYDLMDDN